MRHVYTLTSGNWEPTTGRPYTIATCDACPWEDKSPFNTVESRRRAMWAAVHHCKRANQENE